MISFAVGMQDMVSGPSQLASKGIGSLVKSLGEVAGPAAIAVAALAAVAVAVYGLVSLSISAAQFKRDTLASFSALTGSAQAGQEALDVINELRRKVPETEGELVERAKGLLAAGLDPAEVKQALLAMSAATASGIADAPAALEKVIKMTEANGGRLKISLKQLAALGLDSGDINALAKTLGIDPKGIEKANIDGRKGIEAIVNQLNEHGKNALKEKMLDPGVMFDKFKESLSHLFDGVGDTPGYKEFIDALNVMFAAMGEGTAAGKGMKAGLTSALSGLFSILAKGIHAGTIAFLTIQLNALKLYIFLFPLLKKLHEVFVTLGGWKTLGMLMKALGYLTLFVLSPFIVLGLIFLAIGLIQIALWVAVVEFFTWVSRRKPVHFGRGWSDL